MKSCSVYLPAGYDEVVRIKVVIKILGPSISLSGYRLQLLYMTCGEADENNRSMGLRTMQGIISTSIPKFRSKRVFSMCGTEACIILSVFHSGIEELANHDEYRHIMEEMCNRMWREMADVNDTIFNDYPTVNTAFFGPALAIGKI